MPTGLCPLRFKLTVNISYRRWRSAFLYLCKHPQGQGRGGSLWRGAWNLSYVLSWGRGLNAQGLPVRLVKSWHKRESEKRCWNVAPGRVLSQCTQGPSFDRSYPCEYVGLETKVMSCNGKAGRNLKDEWVNSSHFAKNSLIGWWVELWLVIFCYDKIPEKYNLDNRRGSLPCFSVFWLRLRKKKIQLMISEVSAWGQLCPLTGCYIGR